jgi:hypothetical protein
MSNKISSTASRTVEEIVENWDLHKTSDMEDIKLALENAFMVGALMAGMDEDVHKAAMEYCKEQESGEPEDSLNTGRELSLERPPVYMDGSAVNMQATNKASMQDVHRLFNLIGNRIPLSIPMKFLHDYDDGSAEIKCGCGEEFHVDATTEENLYNLGGELMSHCPACKRIKSKEVEVNYEDSVKKALEANNMMGITKGSTVLSEEESEVMFGNKIGGEGYF